MVITLWHLLTNRYFILIWSERLNRLQRLIKHLFFIFVLQYRFEISIFVSWICKCRSVNRVLNALLLRWLTANIDFRNVYKWCFCTCFFRLSIYLLSLICNICERSLPDAWLVLPFSLGSSSLSITAFLNKRA